MTLLLFLEVVACPTTNLLGVAYLCVTSTKEQGQSCSRGLLQNYQQESRGWHFKEFSSLTSDLTEAEDIRKGKLNRSPQCMDSHGHWAPPAWNPLDKWPAGSLIKPPVQNSLLGCLCLKWACAPSMPVLLFPYYGWFSFWNLLSA